MAKFETILLNINNRHLIGIQDLPQKKINVLTSGNVIYIYKGENSKKVYIGQTKNFLERHKQHYIGNEEKFNVADFNQVLVIISSLFNRSALDDVESQLITYFLADNPKSRKKTVEFDIDEIINLTKGNSVNSYKDREKVASDIIIPLWENYLYPNWVTTPTLEELRSKELVKYSPIKVLTEQQMELINEIESNPNKNYVICGDAGTGKTVLLTHLVASIIKKSNNKRIAVVLQPNWIKTAKNIFSVYGVNSSNLKITTSIKLINDREKYDLIIVDESHKLSRRHSKQQPAFNMVYKDEFKNESHHLDCIQKIGTQVILMYDILQGIRPANITREQYKTATKDYEYKYLTTQFRIQAPEGKNYSSDDYINGIKYLLYKDTGLLENTNFNKDFDKAVFHDEASDAYFGYYENNPLENLINWIEEDRNYNPEHINRVLGGLVEPWKQRDGKDEEKNHWFEGEIKRRWNSTQENWINSDEKDAEDQIGSVFAVQGIDLNKVGVLVGNDLLIDQEGKLYAEPSNFHNVNGKFSADEYNKDEFTLLILNIYYVLMTRGIDGIRLGFWKNDEFIIYMEKVFEIK